MKEKRSDHVKTPAFWSEFCVIRRRFRCIKQALEKLHGVSLPAPMLTGPSDQRVKKFKAFLSDGIEGKAHLWDNHIKRLQRRTRYSIWMSLFLFRKILPAQDPDSAAYMAKISTASPLPDPNLVEFIGQEVKKMFRVGWDKNYGNMVQVATVSTSSCVESRRSHGGARMYWLDRFNRDARASFIDYLYGREWKEPDAVAEVIKVDTGGKVRILTVPPANLHLLNPLHRTMYNHISRFDWLLRGDAKASSFHQFSRKEGEVFVSGDYESATDNLNYNVQYEILHQILEQSTEIPWSIRKLALRSLSWKIQTREEIERCASEGIEVEPVQMASGQMMGFPLSFPLLCIVNYIMFKYAVGRKVPLKVNGDDIVARITRAEYERWIALVRTGGLVLSVGKTMVDGSIFTLNSTLFAATTGGCKLVPFLRTKALYGIESDINKASPFSFVGRYRSFCPGFTGRRLRYLRTLFLSLNKKFVLRAGGSLNRRFGIPASEEALKLSQLWVNETAFLSLPQERPMPMEKSEWSKKPLGYEIAYSQKRKVLRGEEEREFIEAVVASAWEPPSGEKYEQVFEGLKVPKIDLLKQSRLLRMPVGEVRRWLERGRKDIFEKFVRPVRLYPYWRKILPKRCSELRHDYQDQVVVEPVLYPPPEY
ncbi:RNA dependent RNA polymerase [Plasmopara viticola lesion associated ourmia-like virus 19]|uniref:RNA dependent RNA polymerase n=1 Tax=Plasmopara viticola lesion associated ourmia-like virus 19 TaxID=2686486 RepID=A0ABX6FM55_9VIRU|nr:RNA dependent RNA polymerase [Plasmopara viticola lesion associated ourmia-like virus 19]QGY72549.1 RNA dependent RNA polymerase [Plasmopara viticola lesion associated ourmia-like virus 19]